MIKGIGEIFCSMTGEYDEENVFETVLPFRVLRNVHHSEDGTYPVQMKLRAGMDQSDAEDALETLDGLGMLYPVPDTDPQLYKVRYQGLVDAWYDLWEQEVEKIPVRPKHFDKFLEKYIKSYLNTERNSTIEEMLVKDFYTGMRNLELSKEDEFLDSSFREFEARLEDVYEGPKARHKHIQEALGFREKKKIKETEKEELEQKEK